MSHTPREFRDVTAVAKANVFFDGKVVSHSIFFPDGSRKSLGLIFPCHVHFNTDKAERMEITAGQCSARIDGQPAGRTYAAGESFEVAAKSGFDIEVTAGVCEYICSFLE